MRQPAKNLQGIDRTLLLQADERTKGMIGVGKGERPFLDYLLYNARQAALTDIEIVIAKDDLVVKDFYGTKDRGNSFHGLSISYAYQHIPAGRRKPLGTADALLQALRARPDWSGGDCIVCNSDNLYSERAFRLLAESQDLNALIDYDSDGLEFEPERIAQFGIMKKDKEGYVVGITEKPDPEDLNQAQKDSHGWRVSMNIFRFECDRILPYLENCPLHPVRQEQELPLAVHRMVQDHPRTVRAIPLKEHVPDLSYKTDILRVQKYLQDHIPDLDWQTDPRLI